MNFYMLDVLVSFRNRYVISAESEEDAKAKFEKLNSSGDIEEFSQKHLGDLIISNQNISLADYHKYFEQDNGYMKSWSLSKREELINY